MPIHLRNQVRTFDLIHYHPTVPFDIGHIVRQYGSNYLVAEGELQFMKGKDRIWNKNLPDETCLQEWGW